MKTLFDDFDFNENTHSKDDIIYCDIPYVRSGNMYGKDAFDYSEFLKWVAKQNENGFDIFISESDGFSELSGLKPILKIQKQSSMTKKASGEKTSSLMNEYLFLSPAKQN